MPQNNNTVPMLSPDGQAGDIPHDRVKDALAAGGTLGVDVLDPHGNAGLVPMSRIHEVINAGGSLKPPTYVPKVSPDVATVLDPDANTAAGRINNDLATGMGGFTSGIARGIGSTADALNNVYQASQGNVAPLMTSKPAILTPDANNVGDKAGYGLEQAAEYMLPTGVEKLATNAATSGIPRILGRALASGVTNAGVSALHGDTTPEQLSVAAGLGSLGPVVEGVGNVVSSKLPAMLVNATLRPTMRDVAYGRNAGQGVADAGIVAATRNGLASKVVSQLNDVGQRIDATLASYKGGNVDASGVLRSLDDAMDTAAAGGNEELSKSIAGLKQRISNEWQLSPYGDGTLLPIRSKDFTSMSPQELNGIKRQLDSYINYGASPLLQDATRDATVAARGTARNIVNDAVPDVVGLNRDYSNLSAANDALRRNINTPSLINAGVTGAVTGALLGHGGPVLAALNVARKSLRTPLGATGLAALAQHADELAPAVNLGTAAYLGNRDATDAADVDANVPQTLPSALNNTLFNMQRLQDAARQGNVAAFLLGRKK